MTIEEEITNFLRKKQILKTNITFSWEKHSHIVAIYGPQFFDPEKYNWKEYSREVAQYCPHKIDPTKFTWDLCSWAIPKYCPNKIDPELYNWKEHSHYVAMYCPQYFNPKKYNWKKNSSEVAEYCPNKIDPKLYNWKQDSSALIFNHPDHKYIKNAIFNKYNIRRIESRIRYLEDTTSKIWKKYSNHLSDLHKKKKRIPLLNKIAKELVLEKI